MRAESEKRMRTIADNVPAAIAYLNRHERYLFANAAFLGELRHGARGPGRPARGGHPAARGLRLHQARTSRRCCAANGSASSAASRRMGTERHELVDYMPERDPTARSPASSR